MEMFYTVCDIKYAARALCLLRSLELWYEFDEFKLRVICCDPMTERVFKVEPSAQVIPLMYIESYTTGLQHARRNRSWLEYLWTLPSAICSLFVGSSKHRVSYLDADTYFFSDPRALFHYSKLNDPGTSFAVVPHNWTPKYEKRLRPNGLYNVSWIGFNDNVKGRGAAADWGDRCLEWCKNEIDEENERFADQRYLDRLVPLWDGQVTTSPGIGLAPWNQEQYEYSTIILPMLPHHAAQIVSGERTLKNWISEEEVQIRKTRVSVIEKGGSLYPVVFYHFHELRTAGPKIIKLTNYPVVPFVEEKIYKPYAEEYAHAWEVVQHRSV